MANKTDILLQDAKNILENNILNFWLDMDDHRGGFHGRKDAAGVIDTEAERYAVLNSRIVWAFSAAYRHTKKKEYLLAASKAKEYFLEHFVDHKYGGVYWTVDANGEKKDTKAQLYAHGFGIYALSEFYAATRDEEALKGAINIYRAVEIHFADHENGGYIEALARDFSPLEDMCLSEKDINADKTMNSHLHLLEGYASLYRVWPDEGLRGRVEHLLEIMYTKIMNQDNGHLELYFDKQWNVIQPGKKSYGHDVETSWLAMECIYSLKDIDAMDRFKPMCEKLYKAGMEGYCADGALNNEMLADGTIEDSRQWWVQAETVVGNLWAWKYLGVKEGADLAIKTLEYIKSHLIDWENGEWYWSCDVNGAPDLAEDKANGWKCPYHNGRMCLQILNIFCC